MNKYWLMFILVSMTVGCSFLKRRDSVGLSPIVLISDFGTFDDGIAICKGVMIKVDPRLSFIDITHQIPAFSVRDGARFLANVAPHFPEGTVFVAMVEKKIEKPVKPIVAKNKRGQFFVLSDNGLLSVLSEKQELSQIREIQENPWIERGKLVSNFMGRDVYAPVAAHLARGEDWATVGPEIEKIHLLDKRSFLVSETQVIGEVIALDGQFGNLVTDITSTALLNANYVVGDRVSVIIATKKHELPFVKTFGDVAVQEKLLYIDSTDHVAIAINEGNFANRYKIKPPVKITIMVKKGK